ncbi:MAG: saccharopine dehydrogenase NADP-binding domain-containing protein [Halioglobus sp.]
MGRRRFKVLVLGGYGNFGRRICESLAKEKYVELLVAGRDLKKAADLAARIKSKHSQLHIQGIALNIDTPSLLEELKQLAPNLVIHTCGPFQNQSYRVPRTCIAIGAHYIDLADDRRFVCDIGQLKQEAEEKGVLLISGASSVPALSAAVIDHFLSQFGKLERIEYAIAPGNQLDRGYATIKAILSYTGHPFTTWVNSRWVEVYGWMDSIVQDFGAPLGKRHLANIDIPDLELFPERYEGLETLRFRAGLELAPMHKFMGFMAWLAKKKIIKSWAPFARMSVIVSNWFYRFGTDIGGMQVEMAGKDSGGKHKHLTWTLIAEHGVGPHIPTIPAILVARGIANGAISRTGASPCLGFFSLAEFLAYAEGWGIYTRVQSTKCTPHNALQ